MLAPVAGSPVGAIQPRHMWETDELVSKQAWRTRLLRLASRKLMAVSVSGYDSIIRRGEDLASPTCLIALRSAQSPAASRPEIVLMWQVPDSASSFSTEESPFLHLEAGDHGVDEMLEQMRSGQRLSRWACRVVGWILM